MHEHALPAAINLAPDNVHVVYFSLDRLHEKGTALLDGVELDRASRFAFDDLRERFIAAHVWTRIILGCCLSQPPETLCFTYGAHGKPRLCHPFSSLQFNLSHAGEHALLAIALDRDVGVDIEREQEIGTLGLARRVFAPTETSVIQALPQDQQAAAFFRLWTRKEAFVKALGDGLSFPIGAFEVGTEEPMVLSACCLGTELMQSWKIVSLPAPRGNAAAVAAQGSEWQVVCWGYNSEQPSRGLTRFPSVCGGPA
jgi:4'-phosphopantetheinyl transferase